MIICSGNLVLEAFEPAHSALVLAIRNDPSVRAGMRDPAPISAESHQRWVEVNLIRQRRLELFVVRVDGDPVGIALLRDIRDGGAEIGVLIRHPERNARAAYRAAHMLGYYAFEHLGLERLFSNVPRHNPHALEFNRKCGFAASGGDDGTYYRLEMTRSTSRTHTTHQRFLRRHPVTVID